MSLEPVRYRGWTIRLNCLGWPAPDYTGTADDYDGAEDAHDTRVVWCDTVAECKREIDEWIKEHETAPQ